MGKEKLKRKSVISSFTSDGEHLAVLSPNGHLKIWCTSNGYLMADWKQPDEKPNVCYTCMDFNYVGKKRKKECGTCLVALGTESGDVLAVNAFTGQMKWQSDQRHLGGILGLSFAKKGHSLLVLGNNGMVCEVNSKSGELIREFRSSKKPPSSSAFSSDGSLLAVGSSRLQLLSTDNEEEILKFSVVSGCVRCISISGDAKEIITSGYDEKHLQVWRCDLSARTAESGPALSMKHPPSMLECRNSIEESSLVILAVSESGIAYVWQLRTFSKDEVNPSKIRVKAIENESNQGMGGSVKRSRTSIISARLHATEMDGRVKLLVAYGLVDFPEFCFVDISKPGEDILLNYVVEADTTVTETIGGDVLTKKENLSKDSGNLESSAAVSVKNKKANKKRVATTDPDVSSPRDGEDTGHGESIDGVLDDDLNEPTMGEKLSSLNLIDSTKDRDIVNQESSPHTKPPSADSVHILLKQALHADDRVLLLDCLYTQDEKVIANSISLLSFSDVTKLLNSLISIIQSRGAVLACALPWLRSLLLQHASRIMSQESSLLSLNSLYQLIDSRVSTFQSALQLSSCLDFLYDGIVDDGFDESDKMIPIIFEDTDESDEEKSEDAMETDEDEVEEASEGGVSDVEGSEDLTSD